MSTGYELVERIQKYSGIEKFAIINKNGTLINTEVKNDEKGKPVANNFNNNLVDIAKLVDKTNSVVRDLDPTNDLSFIQVSYSGYEYLIAPDEDLYVFTAVRKEGGQQKN